MSINVGHLYRKRTVRSLSGNIIDMIDETNGGVIISKGRAINQERLDELAKIEADKKQAAIAFTQPVSVPDAISEQRVAAPTKLQEMEKRLNDQDGKLDAILSLLSKPKKKK